MNPITCRCGKTFGETKASLEEAIYIALGDGYFHAIWCSRECERAYPNCFFCKGPAHPATGHVYTPSVIACGPCYRDFIPWFKGRLRNPIALAATVAPGTIIEGPWTAEDEERRQKARERRRKSRAA